MLILYELYLHCLKPQLKVNRILQKNFDWISSLTRKFGLTCRQWLARRSLCMFLLIVSIYFHVRLAYHLDGNNTTDEPKHSEKELWLRFLLWNSSVLRRIFEAANVDGHAMDQTSFVSCVIGGTVCVCGASFWISTWNSEENQNQEFQISECYSSLICRVLRKTVWSLSVSPQAVGFTVRGIWRVMRKKRISRRCQPMNRTQQENQKESRRLGPRKLVVPSYSLSLSPVCASCKDKISDSTSSRVQR